MKCSDLTTDVSFHDSRLVRVEQGAGRIVLHLDTAAAHLCFLGHGPSDEYLELDHVRLECEAAHTLKLEFWTDTTAPSSHPFPAHPIDEIMENCFKEGVLEISGFGPAAGWVVWRIGAERFTLYWERESRRKI